MRDGAMLSHSLRGDHSLERDDYRRCAA